MDTHKSNYELKKVTPHIKEKDTPHSRRSNDAQQEGHPDKRSKLLKLLTKRKASTASQETDEIHGSDSGE